MSGLYAPQQVDEVEEALQEVLGEAKGLRELALRRMEKVVGEKAKTELRWLGLWDKQISKNLGSEAPAST